MATSRVVQSLEAVIVVMYTSQDVSEEMSLHYPQLYALGVRNTFFSHSVFVLTIVEGVFAAVIIYFIPYCTMQQAIQPDGRGLVDHKTFGVVVQSALTITVILRVSSKMFIDVKLQQMLHTHQCS